MTTINKEHAEFTRKFAELTRQYGFTLAAIVGITSQKDVAVFGTVEKREDLILIFQAGLLAMHAGIEPDVSSVREFFYGPDGKAYDITDEVPKAKN